MADKIWTYVEISVFKPTGYIVDNFVRTENRGDAIVETMGLLAPGERMCVNTAVARYCDDPKDLATRPDGRCARSWLARQAKKDTGYGERGK